MSDRRFILRRWADALEIELQQSDQTTPSPDRTPARRGAVLTFSPSSRSRMLRQMARTLISGSSLFCTLTLSDAIVARFLDPAGSPDIVRLAQFLKDKQKALVKRAWRKFGRDRVAFLWRIEIQPRKSGRFEGLPVPHVHWLLVVHPGSPRRFRDWLRLAWWEICGRADDGHRDAGTQCDPVFSRRHAVFYVSKYMSKADVGAPIGRRWGVMGNLPQPVDEIASFNLAAWVDIRRLLVRWLRAKGGRSARYGARISRQRLKGGAFVYGAGLHSEGVGDLGRALLRGVT